MRARVRFSRPILVCAATAALVLGGCATNVALESACAQTDWHAVGVDDGSLGRPLVQLDQHRASCHGEDAALDEAAYMLGRLEGLENYCTMATGAQVGQTGGVYSGACPAGSEYYFLTGFRVGHEIHRIDRSIDQNRIDASRLSASLDKSGVDKPALQGQLARLDVDYERLMERAAFLEAETQRVIVTGAYAGATVAD